MYFLMISLYPMEGSQIQVLLNRLAATSQTTKLSGLPPQKKTTTLGQASTLLCLLVIHCLSCIPARFRLLGTHNRGATGSRARVLANTCGWLLCNEEDAVVRKDLQVSIVIQGHCCFSWNLTLLVAVLDLKLMKGRQSASKTWIPTRRVKQAIRNAIAGSTRNEDHNWFHVFFEIISEGRNPRVNTVSLSDTVST